MGFNSGFKGLSERAIMLRYSALPILFFQSFLFPKEIFAPLNISLFRSSSRIFFFSEMPVELVKYPVFLSDFN